MCNSKIIFIGGCFISDISYNGFNLGSKIQQIKTAEDCQKKCQEADGCAYFTWNSKTTSKNKETCYLKSQPGEVRDYDSQRGKMSGPKYCPTSQQGKILILL